MSTGNPGDEVACSWDGCEKAFDTQQAMKTHYGIVHESGVTQECDWCGDEFTQPPAIAERSKYCSTDCMGAAYEGVTGADNHNWEGGRVEKTCTVCGDLYECYPYEADERETCGGDCMYELRGERHSGEGHWRYSKVEVECTNCNDTLLRQPHRVESHDHHFCSHQCHSDWAVDTGARRGQKNPQWTGGSTLYRAMLALLPGHWAAQRDKTRESQDHQCQTCGDYCDPSDRAADVHHIVPAMSGGTNESWNLLCLCAACHRKAELYTQSLFEPIYTH